VHVFGVVLFDEFRVVIVRVVLVLGVLVGSFLLGTTDTTQDDKRFFLPPPSLSPLKPKTSKVCLLSRLKADG